MGPVCGESCINAYKVEGREAPCERCRKQPTAKNQEAVDTYLKVQNQVIVAGMGDVIALNYASLEFVMNLFGVNNRRECFEKVLIIFNEIRSIAKENNG